GGRWLRWWLWGLGVRGVHCSDGGGDVVFNADVVFGSGSGVRLMPRVIGFLRYLIL
ncbi:hypothetical protein A2U01_0111580, partial [Trifolium medium]|nr:hypothetical protein [Trifolium medium]